MVWLAEAHAVAALAVLVALLVACAEVARVPGKSALAEALGLNGGPDRRPGDVRRQALASV